MDGAECLKSREDAEGRRSRVFGRAEIAGEERLDECRLSFPEECRGGSVMGLCGAILWWSLFLLRVSDPIEGMAGKERREGLCTVLEWLEGLRSGLRAFVAKTLRS